MSFPRLLFISGPLQGQSLDLTAREVFIGRDEGNTIVLNHGSVSRKHCRIHKTGESYEIEDLESKNGTFLNGIPKRAGLLQHGADIRIGSTHILFLNRPEEMPAEFLMDDPVEGQSTVILRESDLVYENERLMARNSATEHRLSQLLQLAKLLSQLRSADELPALFAAMLEAVPVQRAALMLGANAEDLQRAWFWNRQAGAVPAFRLSRTVLRSAFSDRTFVMHQGLVPDSAASLVAEGVQSVICVPLLRPNRVLGAIYMDSARSAQSLTEDHLQFVSAAAGLTALAIDNLRMLESLREENQYLRDEAGARKFGIVGQSVATQQLFEFIRKAAPADLTVLVLGESGVGKELVARAIHAESSRAAKNFVAVNCAAFTESLLESDLFGHEKGAFTGAIQQQMRRQ